MESILFRFFFPFGFYERSMLAIEGLEIVSGVWDNNERNKGPAPFNSPSYS